MVSNRSAYVEQTPFGYIGCAHSHVLSGMRALEYITGNSNETVTIPTLKAVSDNGQLLISGLTAGDELKVYNAAGALIYNVRKVEAAELRLYVEPGIYIIASGKRTLKASVK
ncbi:MAG: hypothetical protein LBD21_03870 [Tannerellaceae bacterium]|jgi:hypothetical protein|nr:hypothetical protein [Tannerellaceae bacterium]